MDTRLETLRDQVGLIERFRDWRGWPMDAALIAYVWINAALMDPTPAWMVALATVLSLGVVQVFWWMNHIDMTPDALVINRFWAVPWQDIGTVRRRCGPFNLLCRIQVTTRVGDERLIPARYLKAPGFVEAFNARSPVPLPEEASQ